MGTFTPAAARQYSFLTGGRDSVFDVRIGRNTGQLYSVVGQQRAVQLDLQASQYKTQLNGRRRSDEIYAPLAGAVRSWTLIAGVRPPLTKRVSGSCQEGITRRGVAKHGEAVRRDPRNMGSV